MERKVHNEKAPGVAQKTKQQVVKSKGGEIAFGCPLCTVGHKG